jgi:hypothetical protein
MLQSKEAQEKNVIHLVSFVAELMSAACKTAQNALMFEAHNLRHSNFFLLLRPALGALS